MVRQYNGSTYETLFTFVSLCHLLVIKEACGVVDVVFDWRRVPFQKTCCIFRIGGAGGLQLAT